MESLGHYLRTERELRQISLEEVAQTTRIPLRTLQRIEQNDFEALPGDVFTRGFLKSYASSVGLSSREVLARYGSHGEARQPEQELSSPSIPAASAPERGRRFGIAIALVILLILFTLALSIVHRPRRRDTPIELSEVTAPVELPAPLA